jgi:methylphosphotriester-DNA--protein-cysteine methyltransferase
MDVTREIESGTPEQVRIVKMAEAMGMNVKTFERRFRKTIGLTPKSFSAIIRLQQAIRSIQKNGPAISHGDLMDALNSGYYDQSHFIKSCLRITGLTPKKILTGLPTQITDLIIME